jgi:hypothetical protein
MAGVVPAISRAIRIGSIHTCFDPKIPFETKMRLNRKMNAEGFMICVKPDTIEIYMNYGTKNEINVINGKTVIVEEDEIAVYLDDNGCISFENKN